jgi:hypothetical protein
MVNQENEVFKKLLVKRVGFSFKEEDLSPSVRKKWSIVYSDFQQYVSLANERSKLKTEAGNWGGLVFCALFLIMWILTLWDRIRRNLSPLMHPAYIVTFMFPAICSGIYAVITHFNNRKMIQKRMKIDAILPNLRTNTFQKIEELGNNVYNDLSEVWKSKVSPTVKHITVDFSQILSFLRDKGVLLEAVKCPYCSAPLELPKKGNNTICKYCRNTIQAVDVFKYVKSIL